MGNLFERITFYDNGAEKWVMNGPFSQDFTVGAMAAGESIINILNDKEPKTHIPRYNFKYTSKRDVPGDIQYTTNESRTLVRLNTIHTEFYQTFPISIMKVCEFIQPGYNIWIKDNNGNANLFNFRSSEFIQGIVTMTNAFQVSYLDVIVACPIFMYYYDGNRKIKYVTIDGYPLPFFPLTNGEPFLDTMPEESYALGEMALNAGHIIPTLNERLDHVRQFLENNYRDIPTNERNKLIGRIMSEIPGIILYSEPNDDAGVVEQYIGFRSERDIGDNKGEESIERFLRKWNMKI